MYLFIKKNLEKVFPLIIFSVFLFVLFIIRPSTVEAATLSINPPTGNFEVGSRVSVKVIVTSGVPFNAVSGTLSFPSSVFTVESVSKANSILDFWVTEPIVQKNPETVKFEGVVLGGFLGSSGTVITINLRAIKSGSGNFAFQSGQILANDGEGTDITGNLIGATYSVRETESKPIEKINPEPKEPFVPEVPQPKPTLKAPEIMLGSKYGAPAVLGISDYPKAQALVTFVAPDGAKVFILGSADNEGSFSLLVPNSLKRGTYTVSAVMVKEDKTNSDVSNTIVIKIGSIFSDIGWEVYGIMLLLILLILYLLWRVFHHITKGIDTNKDLKRELHEAENVIHKSFDILREDVIDYDNEKLSTTEHKRMAGIKKDISDAEKVITKEIKDID